MPAVSTTLIWILTGLVLLGALSMLAGAYEFLLLSLHGWHDHYDEASGQELPRVAVLVPAWNEVNVLRFSIDHMMTLDYPAERLRVVVVDDGSDDGTPELLADKAEHYPGRVLGLRRENGGQGKAFTLNHGLRVLLADDWAEAILITDADVVFEASAIRRMVRHLADPTVGAVTGFIREASEPPNWLNRYIGYEYCTAQAAGRRAQNVVGAQACLAGGAQLHSRANLEALGGQIDTSTLAEDTVTTFLTQLDGRRVIFDGNATCLAEEPGAIAGLWKQRLRWSRGNVQVSIRFRRVFFRRSRQHHLGGPWFSTMWLTTLLMPALMVLSSTALVTLWFLAPARAHSAFRWLWIISALAYVFTTTFALLVDRDVARRSWRQAIAFPGLINLSIVAWVLVPGPMHALVENICLATGLGWSSRTRSLLALSAYIWVAACMLAAWLVYRIDRTGRARPLVPYLLFIAGYGPLLCAITFAAYVAEARGTAAIWDKTIKTGKVGAR
jgi:cellulose synthase/poly-beta-1,6-N-acetylglucosamine synthase-like glycosyltransferase